MSLEVVSSSRVLQQNWKNRNSKSNIISCPLTVHICEVKLVKLMAEFGLHQIRLHRMQLAAKTEPATSLPLKEFSITTTARTSSVSMTEGSYRLPHRGSMQSQFEVSWVEYTLPGTRNGVR